MHEEQRNGISGIGGLMEVVDIYFLETIGFQGCVAIRKFVEFGFLCSPVETGLPVFG